MFNHQSYQDSSLEGVSIMLKGDNILFRKKLSQRYLIHGILLELSHHNIHIVRFLGIWKQAKLLRLLFLIYNYL